MNKNTFKIITITLLLSSSVFARQNFENYQKELVSINIMDQKQTKNETCSKLNNLTSKIEKDLFESTCPNSSDLDYNLCQQNSDNPSYLETQKLQKILNEIKKVNSVTCLENLNEKKTVATAY